MQLLSLMVQGGIQRITYTYTQFYTHVAIEKLQAIHEATHPAPLWRQEAAPAMLPESD